MRLLSDLKKAYHRRLLLGDDPEHLGRFVRRELCSLLRFVHREVPFYAGFDVLADVTPENCLEVLSKLPVVSKDDLRSDPSRRAGFVGEDWPRWINTGGSTGEPFRFPIGGLSKWAPDTEQLSQAWLYRQMTGKFEPVIVAVDGSRISDAQVADHIFWTSGTPNFPYGSAHFSTLHLASENFGHYVDKLEEIAPEVIRGYPSGIGELARLAREKGYAFKFRPKGIYLTSENITPAQVSEIESVFGCPVWGQYGHTESSVFAYSRPGTQVYECLPLVGVTEVLRPDGSHVSPGETGEVVVTGFSNRAQPFVRYRTGDLAEFGGRRGAVTILNRLQGRDVDYIIDASGAKHYLVGLIFGGHIEAFNHIAGWQLEQVAPGELNVYIIPGRTFTKTTEAELIDFFRSHGFSARLVYVIEMKKTGRGKQPFLLRGNS